MRRPTFLAILASLALSVAALAQNPAPTSGLNPESPSGRLPVERVVLYKNGVGYFEHAGRVRGSQELNIDFTTAQLNDVLKSLTVLDLGEGRISSVRYNSVAPLSERLRALHLPLGAAATQQEFLNALRGARLSVRSGTDAATGKLLSVETKRKLGPKGDTLTEVTEVSLVTDGGDLRSFKLGPGASVRIVDHDLNEEVGQYLNVIGSARAQDLRRMTINATGTGEREVFVSYISEVPVWKSTYRLIMPDKPGEKPLLQGWAIVDNTIGEDWKDVQLSLVAGAPQSFVQEISQPYYVRRPEVSMPESFTLSPQTHETGMAPPPAGPGLGGGVGSGVGAGMVGTLTTGLGGTVKDPSGAVIPNARVTIRNEMTGMSQSTTTDSNGNYLFYNAQPGNSALFIEAPGFQRYALTNIYLGVGRTNEIHATLNVGAVTETVAVAARAPELNTMSSAMASVVRRVNPEAEGKELGDLFEYNVKQKITIGRNQSALVPILQANVNAEKVTLWNSGDEQARRALWITNTSGMTLDGGSFNVLDAGAFAGEGLIELLHPGEKRLISYAADLAVKVRAKEESERRPAAEDDDEDETKGPFTRVSINKGVMVVTQEERESKTYEIRNYDTTARQVIIEHPARDGWELVSEVKPEETSVSFLRFRVKVEPKKSAKLVVKERHPLQERIELASTGSDEIALLFKQTKAPPQLDEALRRIIAQKDGIAKLDVREKSLNRELETIANDQTRLRENMKALKGSAEEKTLLKRYVSQLDTQEDRIAALRAEVAGLKQKREAAQAELDKTLEGLTLDVTL